ncbi:MAG: NAD(P)H-dependent oxidoreductase [Deltaproteobacteria bacterium]|jgi:multimeric flavodoxin WrbA|nr:NAD(P)H-dependent oxidoreductase [Deltaproteobacteria bacterium]
MGRKIKVCGLHLSPRAKGTSGRLLESFGLGVVDAGADFSVLSVADHPDVGGCRECGACEKEGVCAVKDDMSHFYKAFEKAERLVVATSLFFYDVPAQGKAVVDRGQAFWSRRYRLGRNRDGKPGARGFLLAVGATKGKDLFVPVTLSIKYFFDALAYPKQFDTLFYRSAEEPESLTPEHLLEARAAGRNFAL